MSLTKLSVRRLPVLTELYLKVVVGSCKWVSRCRVDEQDLPDDTVPPRYLDPRD